MVTVSGEKGHAPAIPTPTVADRGCCSRFMVRSARGRQPLWRRTASTGFGIATDTWDGSKGAGGDRRSGRRRQATGADSCDVGRRGRELPWEFSARAGGSDGLDGASEVNEACWNNTNAAESPRVVGTLRPNAWGLFDMHGNGLEWVGDWYGPYEMHPSDDPTGPSAGEERVNRGGSFNHWPRHCRSANRSRGALGRRAVDVGFRLVLPSRPEPAHIGEGA